MPPRLIFSVHAWPRNMSVRTTGVINTVDGPDAWYFWSVDKIRELRYTKPNPLQKNETQNIYYSGSQQFSQRLQCSDDHSSSNPCGWRTNMEDWILSLPGSAKRTRPPVICLPNPPKLENLHFSLVCWLSLWVQQTNCGFHLQWISNLWWHIN